MGVGHDHNSEGGELATLDVVTKQTRLFNFFGEFKSRTFEQAYLQDRWPEMARQLRIVLSFCLLGYIFGSIAFYSDFSDNAYIGYMFGVRILFCLLMVSIILCAMANQFHQRVYVLTFCMLSLLGLGESIEIVAYLEKGGQFSILSTPNFVIYIFLVFAFVESKVSYIAAALFAGTIMVLVPFYIYFDDPWSITLRQGNIHMGSLAFGALAAISTQKLRRRDWVARKQLQLKINELEVARQMSDQANKAKSEFLATVSHELRTPLNGILGILDWIGKQKLNAKVKDRLSFVVNAASHLEALINNILHFTSGESKEDEVVVSHVSLYDLKRDLELTFQPLSERAGLAYEVILVDGAHCDWLIDGGRIKQVLYNLIANAFKFTKAGRVSVFIDSDTIDARNVIKFTVKDTGIGIAKADQQKIFDTFVQIDPSHARSYEGVGLGLALCYKLVNQLNGNLKLRSEPGVGSEFYVELEATPQPSLAPDEQEEIENTDIALKPIDILIIEDSNLNREVYETYLEDMPGRATYLAGGENLLKLLTKKKYDLIITDLHMPEIDGFGVIQMVRSLEAEDQQQNPVPIVVITADVVKENQQKALSLGANEVLMKPLRPEAFYKLLNKYATQHQTGGGTISDAKLKRLERSFDRQFCAFHTEMEELLVAKNIFEIREQTHAMAGVSKFLGKSIVVALLAEWENEIQKDQPSYDRLAVLHEEMKEYVELIEA